MFDGVVRILTNVKYIPKLKRSLISLGVVDTLGYDFSIKKNGIMSINKGTLITMKGKKVKKKKLYFDWKDNFKWSYESRVKP